VKECITWDSAQTWVTKTVNQHGIRSPWFVWRWPSVYRATACEQIFCHRWL